MLTYALVHVVPNRRPHHRSFTRPVASLVRAGRPRFRKAGAR
jgi:hypothetical protein